jgi:hypothetical protein
MSNTLFITLTEFKTAQSDDVSCGFVASDDYAEVFQRTAESWDEFLLKYPTPAAVLEAVLSFTGFDDASCKYTVVDGYPIVQDEESSISGIVFEGDGIYSA